MPVTLTNLQSQPFVLEDYPIIAEYIQGGHGTEIDFYNAGTKTILPGEPVAFTNRLGISKDIILPGHFGTLVFGAWINGVLNPALVAQVTQGQEMYFNIGLASGLYPGYFTNVQPTNGWHIGYALGIHEQPDAVRLSAGVPVAATTSQERCFIQMSTTYEAFGTVTDFLATS